MLFFSIFYWLLVDRLVTLFIPVRPLICSIYDRQFWRHERFWKVPSKAYLQAFNGTPFKNLIWRLAGVRLGRRVFDDGLWVTERTLVTIGDDCTFNAGSGIQSHSQEDGAFKSDNTTIGSGCTLGVGAFVHYGVTVGDGAVIAPDSFLMKGEEVPPQEYWGGNPAREMPVPVVQSVKPTRKLPVPTFDRWLAGGPSVGVNPTRNMPLRPALVSPAEEMPVPAALGTNPPEQMPVPATRRVKRDEGMPVPAALGLNPTRRMPFPAAWGVSPAEETPVATGWGASPAEETPVAAALRLNPTRRMPFPTAWGVSPAEEMPVHTALHVSPAEEIPAPTAWGLSPAWEMPVPAALGLNQTSKMPVPAALKVHEDRHESRSAALARPRSRCQ
jgi:carbonic anhydrase/acetyltransferase-like protein (isoleucine patch superfamily)